MSSNTLIIRAFYVIVATFSLFAFRGDKNIGHSVEILHSTICILGETNVNQFQCNIQLQNPGSEFTIQRGWDGRKLTFDNLSLQYPISEFECGLAAMNSDFQKLLGSDDYPNLTIKINAIDLDDMGSTMEKVQVDSYVAINLAGKTVEKKIEHSYVFNYSDIEMLLTGEFIAKFSEFGLTPPSKAFGMVKAKDELAINYQVRLVAKPL